MTNVITQPYKRPRIVDADNYRVTLSQEFDLKNAVAAAGSNVDLTDFLKAHPSGKARIWAVGISRPALRAWEKIAVGDLVLIYGDGAIYAYGTVSSKINWPQNNHIWPSGTDWDHIYSLTDFHELPVDRQLEYQSLRNFTQKLDVYSVGCRDISEFGISIEELVQFVVVGGPRHGDVRSRIGIPEGITAQDVRTALNALAENGLPSGYGERTDWVLDDNGTWFPPKAVIGLAATRVLGRPLKASEFSGGEGSGQANRILRELGFNILRRHGNGIQIDPIKSWIERLQTTRRAYINTYVAPHQPATIMWLLAQFQKGKPRLQPWSEIQGSLAELIVKTGGGPTPEYPLAVLANEGLVAVQGLNLPLPSTSSEPKRVFNQSNPLFGLPAHLYDELGSQPDRVLEIIDGVRTMFASEKVFQNASHHLELDTDSQNKVQTLSTPAGQQLPGRKARSTVSIQRSVEVARWVKQTYDDTCQVCGIKLQTPQSATSDAAHIRGLGSPHDGPDVIENILCLCPNHHRTFDAGAWSITDDFKIINLLSGQIEEALTIHDTHKINVEFVSYHRNQFMQSK